MKRPKHAKVSVEKKTYDSYSVVCPHCHTLLCGDFNDSILMISCYHCDEIIDFRPSKTRKNKNV